MVDTLSQQFEGQDTNWGRSSLTATWQTIRPTHSKRLRRRRYRRDVRETFFVSTPTKSCVVIDAMNEMQIRSTLWANSIKHFCIVETEIS